jgi:ribosomal protein S4
MQTLMDEDRLKQVFKEALKEMLEEKQSLLHDIVVDAMEDIALSRAIQEGQKSGTATKKQIFDILEGRV